MDLKMGGQDAIVRIMKAYGLHSRQALCEQMGISSSTMGTRWMRDTFPADWVIQCAIETGASIHWLTTGEGVMFENEKTDALQIKRQKLIDGKLYDSNYYIFDSALLPGDASSALAILDSEDVYIIDTNHKEISNGKWVVRIEGEVIVCEITRIPVGRVRVKSSSEPFECALEDIEIVGKISLTIKR